MQTRRLTTGSSKSRVFAPAQPSRPALQRCRAFSPTPGVQFGSAAEHLASKHTTWKQQAAKIGLVCVLKALAAAKLAQAQALRPVVTTAQAYAGVRLAGGGQRVNSVLSDHEKQGDSTPQGYPPAINYPVPVTPQLNGPFDAVSKLKCELLLVQEEVAYLQQVHTDLQQEYKQAGSGSAGAAATSSLGDCGSDFCPLSAELETCKEVIEGRKALMAAVSDYAHLVASYGAGGMYDVPAMLATHPVLGAQLGSGDAVVPELQRLARKSGVDWEQAFHAIIYLQVRIAQLRQLPANPTRKITIAYVKEQLTNDLQFRANRLRQYASMATDAA